MNVAYQADQSAKETLGVPVVTYGRTDDFPAFYSPKSGFKVGVYPIVYRTVDRFSYAPESLESRQSHGCGKNYE